MKLQHPPNGHRLKEELAAAIARAERAEAEIAELRALSIRVEIGGTTYNFDEALATIPAGASIDSITVKIDSMELTTLRARLAELEAAATWHDPQPMPPPEQKVLRIIAYAYQKDNGNWAIKTPILKWQPANGMFIPEPPTD